MKTRNKFLIATAGLLVSVNPGLAEDIDLYSANSGRESNPNVLIVIDSSANWASAKQHWADKIKQGQSELRAVATVASEIGNDINLGLMLFTAGGSSNTYPGGPGGYVRWHIRPMDAMNKDAFIEMIGNPTGCIDEENILNMTPNCIYKNFLGESVATAKTNYSAVMFEVFKYFGGYTSPAHANDDVAGTPTNATKFGPYRYAGAPEPNSDYAAFLDTAKSTYGTAQAGDLITDETNCAANHVIFIGNGFPVQDSAASLLTGVGCPTEQLAMPVLTTTWADSTEVIEASAVCGTYYSASECEAAAASLYGEAYDTYTCAPVTSSTCAQGDTITLTQTEDVPCGTYDSLATCQATLPADTADTTYSCVETSSSCPYIHDYTYEDGFLFQTLENPSACLGGTTNDLGTSYYATSCIALAQEKYPTAAQLNCDFVTTDACPTGAAKWTITAGAEIRTGKTYSKVATTTRTLTSDAVSYKIEGTRQVATVVQDVAADGSPLSAVPTASKARYADEWAQCLFDTDVSPAAGRQSITTHTIDVFKDQQDADQSALLYSMARAGGGDYYAATNEEQIEDALRKIMMQIQSTNSVFASSSLPVSVNSQGSYLNQIFIGMFRPDGSAAPRWAGNLKQYQFKFFTDDTSGELELQMADKNGDKALGGTSGFVDACADSIWTTGTGEYWKFNGKRSAGTCVDEPTYYSDAPDGPLVEKGGAAQKLRAAGYADRKLLTCASLDCAGLMLANFATGTDSTTANITAASLGITGSDAALVEQQKNTLIDWVRGKDVEDENQNSSVSDVRPSVHGAVIHSQPAVVDYGGTTGVIAYYGADSGVFHAVKGGKNDTDGTELWGFIAPETFGRLKRLKDNSPLVYYPNTTYDPADPPARKDYFFDGTIGVHQRVEETTDEITGETTKESTAVWIYPTMRRGGRAIYAFDVTTPAAPTLMWRKGCFTSDVSNDTDCSTGWSDIGQTWSKPQVISIKNYVDAEGTPKPVLVFGGGYDTCEDTDSATTACTTTQKGAGIWFVDAEYGYILRKYPTLKSVPGDVAILKDYDGFAQYVYATDTGGNVYRINVGGGTPTGTGMTPDSAWSANSSVSGIQIAALAGDQARKFLYGPDVVAYRGFNAVLAGTGDRERPLWENYPCNEGGDGVQNAFFMIKDETALGYPDPVITPDPDILLDVTDNTTATVADLDAKKGWMFTLNPCEQVVNKPLTFAGVTYFGTNAPKPTSTTACGGNLGTARGYAVKFLTGNPVNEERAHEYKGGGLPPSPVAGVVDVDGTKTPFVIGGDKESALQGGEIEISPPANRKKLYWNKQNDKE